MAEPLESQIEQWRGYLRRRQAIRPVDLEELEDHLRGEVSALGAAGLSPDEAFLVAVKRMGAIDAISNEFAREHSERLWKQLVLSPDGAGAADERTKTEALVAIVLAVLAAVAVKIPSFFGLRWGDNEANSFYGRNMSLFVFPLVAAYFVWKRPRPWIWLAALFAAGAVFANAYPLGPKSDTLVLSALHLPIALWLLVGMAYAGRRWGESAWRMDFVRF